MTDVDAQVPADENTAAGLMEFLSAAIDKGWINTGMAKAMKTASFQILSVEPNWQNLDLRNLDVDDLFDRFRNLKRNQYSDDSMRLYKTRFLKAMKMHLTRVDGGDWKAFAPVSRSGSAKSTNGGKKSVADVKPATAAQVVVLQEDNDAMSEPAQSSSLLMRFPFPLRDNVDVSLALPRDLTKAEAARLNAFINSLAREEPQIAKADLSETSAT
jgi:hypothetical protein